MIQLVFGLEASSSHKSLIAVEFKKHSESENSEKSQKSNLQTKDLIKSTGADNL
jgi:hypothetical protein